MEQSTAQNPLPGMPHGVNPQGQLPPDYWNGLDPIYSDTHLQAAPQARQDSSAHQTPLGISWDHPVFQQQPQQPTRPQSQSQHRSHATPTDPNHGIYTMPQSWQPNPLHQTTRGYGVSSSFPSQQQIPVPPYQQGQLSFDSRSINPSEDASFPQYAFPPNYFDPQQLPTQASEQVLHQQSTEFPPPTPHSNLPQYAIPPGYPPDLHNTIDLTHDFPSEAGMSHQTIDPQFINPGAQMPGHQGIQENMLFGAPPNFQANDGRVFNYYQNDISIQPQPRAVPALQPAGTFPHPDVVIPTKKAGTKKQTQSKKAGAKTQKSKSRSGSPSSSDDSELEIEAPDEPSPIPATRPTDPVAAAEYDTLLAVWSPRNKRPTADKVKSALVAFKDVIKVLRDAWKDQVQAMKLAENQGNNDKATQLKQDVALQRRIMDMIVVVTMETGHSMIVEKYALLPSMISFSPAFLPSPAHGYYDHRSLKRIEHVAHVNSLWHWIKLLSIGLELRAFLPCSGMISFANVLPPKHVDRQDPTSLKHMILRTNIAKILPRFVKKGGPVIKELAQKVMENAAASTKRKQNNAKAGNEDSSAKNSGADSPSADLVGSKRPRDGESNSQPATKRMTVTSNHRDTSKSGVATNGSAKRPGEVAANGKQGAAAARPRANIVAPKPSSLFGTLSSASKRPGTTNAERAAAAAAAKPIPAKNDEKPAPPPAKPAFSFGDIMADLSKPKEKVVAKPTEERPPETAEEKERRLRKESRRKLRVTWKPDDSLTEVRLFTHDPEEELGPGDGSLRGMGDVKGEGSVLKLHKDLEELEEEDMGGIRETNYHDYVGLSGKCLLPLLGALRFLTLLEIEFESKEMKDANFIKRGGEQQPSSPERTAQDHRESTTLMVFYTSPADVPSTPKEPPAPDPDEVVPDEVQFGELPDHVKARQERYYSYMNPKPTVPPAQESQPAATGGGFDISGLLKLIGNQQQSTPPPPPVPQPPAPAPMVDLERTISMFRQQQAPPPPPVPQTSATQPPAAAMGLQGVLDIMKQMQPQATFQQPQQTQAAMQPNLGAMFSQLAAMNPQGGPPAQPATYEDPDRKRMREVGQYDSLNDSQWARGKRTKANDPKPVSTAFHLRNG
ncbi:Zinc finger CCCH-type [Penicillium capsulatum]|nr:Zinc finger CCCH-type [Penicillium capsulatum]